MSTRLPIVSFARAIGDVSAQSYDGPTKAHRLLSERAMADYAEMSFAALEKAGKKSKDPEELITIACTILERNEEAADPDAVGAQALALAQRANQIQPTPRAPTG